MTVECLLSVSNHCFEGFLTKLSHDVYKYDPCDIGIVRTYTVQKMVRVMDLAVIDI